MLKQKSKIQIVVICGLLIASSFDIVECAKTQKSKSKGSSSSSSSSRTSKPSTNNQAHANPAAFSYGNVNPNAPQSVRPSAPVQQSYAPKPVYNQPAGAPSYPANQPPAPGWNTNQNNQARAPYPVNNNQQFGNPPPQYAAHPNQGPPPVYASNPANAGAPNFNQQPPAYRPQQPAYNPQQPAHNPGQPAYNPQPGYQQPAAGGFAPQQPPQVINNYHIAPQSGGGFGQTGGGFGQQSSGPGLLKTAVVAGAAGLGGAALYNAFKPDHDPKTTVVYVTQPPQAAAPVAPVTQAPEVQPVKTLISFFLIIFY